MTTEITEFEPFKRLAWTGAALGATAHHAWLLDDPAQVGDSHRGDPARVPAEAAPARMGPAMLRQHQRWIDQLARLAESGEMPR